MLHSFAVTSQPLGSEPPTWNPPVTVPNRYRFRFSVYANNRHNRTKRASSFLLITLILCTLPLLFMLPAQGQSRPLSVYGIGGQIGDPSGISYKRFFRVGYAVDVLAAWDLDRSFLAGIHVVNEQPIPDSAFNIFLGPGLYSGILQEKNKNQLRAGLSMLAGLNFYSRRFEVFLQATPRFDLSPRRSLALGGSVGLRYYPSPRKK